VGTIPEAAIIQLDHLKMSMVMLETFEDLNVIYYYRIKELCIKLVNETRLVHHITGKT
jgi:hypothetical protein